MPDTGGWGQAAGQVGAAVITSISGRRAQARAFEYNKQSIDEARAYNTPAMQMQRYKEAGLNPNLMYGQGSPGNADQVAKYMAPEPFKMPAVLGMLSQIQGIKLGEAQERNLEADHTLKANEIVGKQLDNHIKALVLSLEKATFQDQKKIRQELAKAQALKVELLNEGVIQAKTFNKYMDVSQIAGISGKAAQIINMIITNLMKGKK